MQKQCLDFNNCRTNHPTSWNSLPTNICIIYDNILKVSFFTEVTVIGTWYFLNLDNEMPPVYSDFIDTVYWSLPLIPSIQAHKCVLIPTVVIGTCICAWCLEICAWSSCITCSILHQHKEISFFAIKAIRLSEEKTLVQSDSIRSYTVSNFYICITNSPTAFWFKKAQLSNCI